MSKSKLHSLICITLVALSLVTLPHQAHAAKGENRKPKERLVLMPLTLEDDDKKQQGAMEGALIQGLQQKYEVFAGEQVAKKAREIFNKENRKAQKTCDETRCMQGIAEAFQAEFIATASVTKQAGGFMQSSGYFLVLKIENIFDNKVVYSESLPCKGCDTFQVVDKLKELSGVAVQLTSSRPDKPEEPSARVKALDPDTDLWNEVKKSDTVDYYNAYLEKFPKGKYAVLAKSSLKKLNDKIAGELAQKEQSAWDSATSGATEESYQGYLDAYPKGRYVALATASIKKLKKIAAAAEDRQAAEQARQAREAAKFKSIKERESAQVQTNTSQPFTSKSGLIPPSAPIKGHVHANKKEAASKECVSCHERDDIHNGDFGPQCDRCHVGDKWRELKYR